MNRKQIKISVWAIIAFVAAGLFSDSPCEASKPKYYSCLKKIASVMAILEKNYVREVTEKELVDGAIKGILKAVKASEGLAETVNMDLDNGPGKYAQKRRLLNAIRAFENSDKNITRDELCEPALQGMLQSLDPGSSYIDKETYEALYSRSADNQAAIGAEITIIDGILTAVSPLKGSPSAQAGLKPKDKILQIDGETTEGITLIKAVKKLRGKEGSKISLTIERKGFKKPVVITMKRAFVRIDPTICTTLEKRYGYILIKNFKNETLKNVQSGIEKMGGKTGLKGLILDLRNCPGGLLHEAVKIADLFLQEGTITDTKSRLRELTKTFRASMKDTDVKAKLAVLVNKGTASGAELMAAAMQDHDRGLLFGTKSYGRGTIQTTLPLDGGDMISLSTAEMLTPKGRRIQDNGIRPDVDFSKEVEDTKRRYASSYEVTAKELLADPVVVAALDWLKSDVSVTQYKRRHGKISQFRGLPSAFDEFVKKAQEGDAQAYYQIGDAYRTGKAVPAMYGEAKKWLTEGAKKGSAECENALGEMAEAGQGASANKEEAFKHYKKAAEMGNALGQFNLARAYLHGTGTKKDLTKAAKYLQEAAEKGHTKSQTFLGIMYRTGTGVEKDTEKAREWLKKAIGQGSDQARVEMARLLVDEGKLEEADNLLTGINKESNQYLKSRIVLALAFLKGKRYDKALPYAEECVKAGPKDADMFHIRGSILEEQEKLGDAIRDYRKALELSPKNTNVRYSLGRVLEKEGNVDAALVEMEKIIKEDPKHASALNFVGYTLFAAGKDLQKAENYIQRAYKLKPNDGYILDSYAWLLFKKGKKEEALTLLQKSVKKVPADCVILEHLGDVLAALNRRDEASDAYRKAIEVSSKDIKSLKEKLSKL